MDGFGASTYGDGFAEVYDRWYPEVTDTTACVALLAELAGLARSAASAASDGSAASEGSSRDGSDGRANVLELGIGTGRLALPLAERGLAVTGVDASTEMVAQLAGKAGADRLTVVVGDMAELEALLPLNRSGRPRFELVFAAYNTLFNLPTIDAQRACLTAVEDRLAPAGRLVIEGFVPTDEPATRPDDVAVSRISATELVLSATVHDRDAQTITGQHVEISQAGVKLRPWLIRYLRPLQLDDLAAEAGLELEHRWAGWHREPFDDSSPVHVSVYGRTP